MQKLIIIIKGFKQYIWPEEQDGARFHGNECTRELSKRFGASVEQFQCFEESDSFSNENFLREKAKKVATRIQETCQVENVPPDVVIFIASDIGVSLAKEIILFALRDMHSQWIAHRTAALVFVGSSSFTLAPRSAWPAHPSQRHSANEERSVPLSIVPSALSDEVELIETRFAAIANGFDVKHYQYDEFTPTVDEKLLATNSAILDLYGVFNGHYQRGPSLDYENKGCLHGPYTSNLYSYHTGTYPELMRVIKEQNAYVTWLEDDYSSILGAIGPPGSGNSVLATHVLNSLVTRYQGLSAVVLSFNFNRWDNRFNSEKDLAFSLMRQLLISVPQLSKRYESLLIRLIQQRNPPSTYLWRLFRLLVDCSDLFRVVIVINAVDQCLQPISKALACIVVHRSVSTSVKILATSSAPFEIPGDVRFQKIDTQGSQWKEALRSVVIAKMTTIIEMKPRWKALRDMLVDVTCRGQLNHLDAMLQLRVLASDKIGYTRASLRRYLITTPVPSFEQVFSHISTDGTEFRRARLALNWIFHTLRPLKVAELEIALTLETMPSHDDATGEASILYINDNMSRNFQSELEELLGILVKVVDGEVLFVHHTFRDHFNTISGLMSPGFHSHIARKCLSYIEFVARYELKTQPYQSNPAALEAIDTTVAFLEYSVQYWAEHYRLEEFTYVQSHQSKEEARSLLDDKVLKFLQLDSEIHKVWLLKLEALFDWTLEIDISGSTLLMMTRLELNRVLEAHISVTESLTPEVVQQAVNIAAQLGSYELLQTLERHLDPSLLAPPVLIAATFGNLSALEALLDRAGGKTLSYLDRQGDDPLTLAAASSHTEVVRLLLNRGWDARTRNKRGHTAVHNAAENGDIDTMMAFKELREHDFRSILLMKHEDVDLPLQMAARSGHVEAFDLLLDSTDLEWFDQQRYVGLRTSFELASSAGHAAIVEKLLSSMIMDDVDHTGIIEQSLWNAVDHGHLNVVTRLLENYRFRRSIGYHMSLKTSLHLSIFRGWIDLMNLLLSKISSSAKLNKGYMAIAVGTGNLRTIETLVAHGIDYKAVASEYKRNLDRALAEERVDTVNYLTKASVKPCWDGRESSIHCAARVNSQFCLREILTSMTEDEIMRKDYQGLTALDVAAKYGHFDACKELLFWADKGTRGPLHRTPKTLFLAIQSGVSDLVNLLLSKDWHLRCEDEDSNSPLHVAVGQGNIAVLQSLLGYEVEIDKLNNNQEAAIHVAIKNNRPELVKVLLNNGADPNAHGGNLAPLHVAAKLGDDAIESVRLLLTCRTEHDLYQGRGINIDVNQRTIAGWTALHYAHHAPEVTKELLKDQLIEVDAMLSDSVTTPLVLAVEGGNEAVAKLLLSAKADANILFRSSAQLAFLKDFDNLESLVDHVDVQKIGGDCGSPLHTAVRTGNVRLVELLLKNGASPLLFVHPFGTPLHTIGLEDALSDGVRIMIKTLLASGANINSRDWNGRTLLSSMGMIFYGDVAEDLVVDVIEELLSNGADPDVKDDVAITALHAAACYGSLEVVEKLLETSSNLLVADGCSRSAIYWAAMSRTSDAQVKFEALVSKIPRNERVHHLSSVIPPASGNGGCSGILKCILEVDGIELDWRDRNGWTGLDLATAYGDQDLILALQQKGARANNFEKFTPTSWAENDRCSCIYLSENRLEVYTEGGATGGEEFIVGGLARADHCMSRETEFYYFEIEVIGDVETGPKNVVYFDANSDSGVAVGFCEEYASLHSLAGWGNGSWGYHSDDGLFRAHGIDEESDSRSNVSPYGNGDVIGVGINFRHNTASFSKNGESLGIAFQEVKGQLYPCVSLWKGRSRIRVRVNFGTQGQSFKHSMPETIN